MLIQVRRVYTVRILRALLHKPQRMEHQNCRKQTLTLTTLTVDQQTTQRTDLPASITVLWCEIFTVVLIKAQVLLVVMLC